MIASCKFATKQVRGTNLNGQNITVRDTIIDARTTGDVLSFPFNTDGFDIVAQDVLIENSLILNGDDAFAIQVYLPLKPVSSTDSL